MKMAEIPFDEKAKLGYVWLIWGVTDDRRNLIAIATTEEARQRYVESGERLGTYRLVLDEKAFVDHLYGGRMMTPAYKILRRAKRGS